MFRQKEVIVGGWRERTLEARRKRRYEMALAQMTPLGEGRIEQLPFAALVRRIEQSWQEIERKPMRSQQIDVLWRCILDSIGLQAGCLSPAEYGLVEQAMILGDTIPIEDAEDLDAARALSQRLWGHIGLMDGKAYFEFELPVLRAAAQALVSSEHLAIRMRMNRFHQALAEWLYRFGSLDDRLPQKLLIKNVFGGMQTDALHSRLARYFLWACCDCIDYSGGVMLVHPAFADPAARPAYGYGRNLIEMPACAEAYRWTGMLPEEESLQRQLEQVIAGSLRDGQCSRDAAQTIRFLCKQGAPLHAMEEALQSFLVVHPSAAMRSALADMYYRMPKWAESSEHSVLQ